MKKFFSFVMSLALFVSLMCTPLFALKPENEKTPDSHDTACAEDTENSDQQTAAFPSYRTEIINGKTCFVIEGEPVDVPYQLTPEELNLSTEELVDLIIEYDLLSEFRFCSGTDADAYRIGKSHCNVLSELESRPDAASVLLSKWLQLRESEEQSAWDCSRYLSTVLSQPVYVNRLTESEKEIWKEALYEQYGIIETIETYSSTLTLA